MWTGNIQRRNLRALSPNDEALILTNYTPLHLTVWLGGRVVTVLVVSK